jgi:acyl-CoA synthetase (AMP-forming)/AMP-acid ligase II
MFTSGTTGKPKAVSLKPFLLAVSVRNPQDTANANKYYPLRTYTCLPLFHATSFLVGIVHSCGVSGTLCLSRKFVVAAGNGLQADVWTRFQERFNVPEIRGFYRSTESVAGFDNSMGGFIGVGKVGFSGLLGRWMEDTMFIVRYDHETETLYRDPETGFCVKAADGEPGEAIGRVTMREFYSDYHRNPSANNSKLVKDVFRKGDLFQRTGDLLIRDPDGWVRFHERTGDTFRWRGENVSSAEVKEFMLQLQGDNIHDIVVYGTKVPGYVLLNFSSLLNRLI